MKPRDKGFVFLKKTKTEFQGNTLQDKKRTVVLNVCVFVVSLFRMYESKWSGFILLWGFYCLLEPKKNITLFFLLLFFCKAAFFVFHSTSHCDLVFWPSCICQHIWLAAVHIGLNRYVYSVRGLTNGFQTEYFTVHDVRLDWEKAYDVSVKHVYFTVQRLFSTHSPNSASIDSVFFEKFFPPKSVCIAYVFFETIREMYCLKRWEKWSLIIFNSTWRRRKKFQKMLKSHLL